MRPGIVDDIKHPQEEYGQHMAMDVHSYPTKSSSSFKQPDITYEGFVPCSPPQCKRANSPSHYPIPSKPQTTIPPPPPPPPAYKEPISTTHVPVVYKTTTRGLPLYNPPSPKPSYDKPSEHTPNGFLVDYHPFKDVSNGIEEPNLCKFIVIKINEEMLKKV